MALPTAQEIQDFIRELFPDDREDERFLIEAASPTRTVVRLRYHEKHLRPGATMLGPVQMALADTAGWVLILATLGLEAAASVTSSLNINFLSRPGPADLLAEGAVLKLGKRSCVCEVKLFSAGNLAPVAQATVTYAVRVAART